MRKLGGYEFLCDGIRLDLIHAKQELEDSALVGLHDLNRITGYNHKSRVKDMENYVVAAMGLIKSAMTELEDVKDRLLDQSERRV
jgi:hypothetical protein